MPTVRHGDKEIIFEGEKIAFVTAELPSKDRWTEFTIYLSIHSEWILQGVGRSRLEGETDRYWTVISKDPLDIINSLVNNEVSRLAKKLIAESLNFLKECPECEEEVDLTNKEAS